MIKQKQPGKIIRGFLKLFRKMGYDFVPLPFTAPRECNICGYKGRFRHAGFYYIRPDALCLGCWSTDRDRLVATYIAKGQWTSEGKDILHFAPENNLVNLLKPSAASYTTADLFNPKADKALNIEQIDSPDASFDAVVCSHVLEHVDTPKALGELHRILRPGGTAILMVPMYEGLDETYFDASVPEDQRTLHYHQSDHIRLIGRDFRSQITDAGFTLSEYNADPTEITRYGMVFGEKIFVATKPKG